MKFYSGELFHNVSCYFSFHSDQLILSTLYEDIPVLLSAHQEKIPLIFTLANYFFRKKKKLYRQIKHMVNTSIFEAFENKMDVMCM